MAALHGPVLWGEGADTGTFLLLHTPVARFHHPRRAETAGDTECDAGYRVPKVATCGRAGRATSGINFFPRA